MKNKYIQAQIDNMLQMNKVFVQSCQFAAMEDDGEISKEEKKILDEITKASEAFEKSLKKVK